MNKESILYLICGIALGCWALSSWYAVDKTSEYVNVLVNLDQRITKDESAMLEYKNAILKIQREMAQKRLQNTEPVQTGTLIARPDPNKTEDKK